ncbi:hypothetical protein C8R44DRAFT_744899 [Mycena epipterygia]|nr:hypothetical protein C8R44DRAFT_744899 [Mycena epipterygia]
MLPRTACYRRRSVISLLANIPNSLIPSAKWCGVRGKLGAVLGTTIGDAINTAKRSLSHCHTVTPFTIQLPSSSRILSTIAAHLGTLSDVTMTRQFLHDDARSKEALQSRCPIWDIYGRKIDVWEIIAGWQPESCGDVVATNTSLEQREERGQP